MQLISGDGWLNVTNKYIIRGKLKVLFVLILLITNCELQKPSKLKVLKLGVLSKSHENT